MRTLSFTVPQEYDGRKLLGFLRQSKLSSRLINSLKQYPDGMLRNGEHVRTIDIIHAGDTITVNIHGEDGVAQASTEEPDVVYGDEDILVINKPAGLAMHESHNHRGDTLANEVAGYLSRRGEPSVFRAVGRLDKDTSGLVVCALHVFAASNLPGNIQKTYYAVVQGEYSGSGTIDRRIYRPDPMKTLRAAGDRGETAVTHWTALASAQGHTLMRIRLETGRTHQIRVHFSSQGTPLAGDDMYSGDRTLISRQALHCGDVQLLHPVTGQVISLHAPLPDDMKRLLSKLGINMTDI